MALYNGLVSLQGTMNAALENEITCGVCSEVYSPVAGREPVMLPECGHTFCRECLLNLQTTAVVCPNCRQRHYSPAVEDLAVNFAQLGIAVALSNIQKMQRSQANTASTGLYPLEYYVVLSRLSHHKTICARMCLHRGDEAYSLMHASLTPPVRTGGVHRWLLPTQQSASRTPLFPLSLVLPDPEQCHARMLKQS
ncbi:kelch motif family protein [Penaeus vannamei]|uniref:Kelch motif family protein n=1 Tax=Penaeus vannamei TaxID=6689 RepID=A0A3R7QGP3_PENVA|nr:kelch motif family protein [Penaeus vannamei]